MSRGYAGLPVIGLIKREYPGYTGRITMTMREAQKNKNLRGSEGDN